MGKTWGCCASTDYEGRFRIDDLEPDTYRLGLTHPGKALVHNGQVDLHEDQDITIRLQAGGLRTFGEEPT